MYMRKKILLTVAAFMLLLSGILAQTTEITGKVVDNNGAPIPNASVFDKKTKTGTVTEMDGSFHLKVSRGTTLLISSVGFDNKEVKAEGTGLLTISLSQTAQALSEVVVTGVGVATSKKRVAIAVQTISSDKLPVVPSGSIDQALVGKIAGAQITSSSGNPGSPVSIQLRGVNTIQGGSQPMILVDGVEIPPGNLNSLDLNTIDKVEVVQGAAAATIYGAQGANGVIQIFTKKGKPGSSRIDASARVSWDSFINVGKVHQPFNHSFQTDAQGDIVQQDGSGNFVKLIQDSLGIWGQPIWLAGPNDQNNIPYKDNTHYYDHIAQLFHQAMTTNYSVSASGGKEHSDYAITASQLKQESIIDGYLKRTNLTLNLGFEPLKNLKLRAISQLVYTQSTLGNNQISSALYTYPFANFDYKDAEGNHTFKFGGAGANSSNPYYYRQYLKYHEDIVDVLPSLNANYKFPRFLELDYKYAINYTRDDYERDAANQTLNKSSAAYNYFVGEGITGGIYNSFSRYVTQNSLATATLKLDGAKDFGMAIPLTSTTTAAYDWRKKKSDGTSNDYIGMPLYDANANQANQKVANGVYEDNFITFGYFFNQRFEWGDIAGISGGFRSDYSSTFGDTKKPLTFPRGDVYFTPSSLKLWENVAHLVPLFKLRAAYGEAGIQPGVFDRISTLNNTNFDNGAGFYNVSRVANPLLTVERSKELEVGTDIGLNTHLNDWFSSINLSATVWNRKGKGIIWVVPLAISSGASEIKTNAVDLSSKGIEISLDASIYKSKIFNWSLNAVFGKQQSKTDAIYGATDIPLVWGSGATYTLRPGEEIGTVYGYKALTSVDQKDAQGNYYIDQSQKANYTMVDGRVVEIAGKKVMFTSDKYLLGNTTPKFTTSFTNTLNYKGFASLSFQFDWIGKALQYNQTKEWMYSEGLHGDFDKPVTIAGQTGAFAAYYKSFYDASESNGTKDYFLENSSFVRLRNVSLGIDLAHFMKVSFTNKLQLVFSGRNLLTWTKYTGMDPEANQNTSGGGTVPTNQTTVQKGLDYFSFPNTKSYQIGINIGLNQ